MARRKLVRHKRESELEAEKIVSITVLPNGTADLVLEGDPAAVNVSADFLQKYSPVVGGYYIVDGREVASYVPADRLERGYKKIQGQ